MAGVKIFVAEPNSQYAEQERPFLLISPNFTKFDDFGQSFKAFLTVYPVDSEIEQLDVRIMFSGIARTYDHIKKFVTKGKLTPLEIIQEPFCSVLEEDKSYHTLVQLLTFEFARDALLQLGDAAILDLYPTDKRSEILNSVEFTLGALRTPSAFRSRRRGGRFLRPDVAEIFEDAAKSFTILTALPPHYKDSRIEFDFERDEFIRDRICVLVGPNGTGKTSLLVSLIRSLRNTPKSDLETAIARITPKLHANRVIVFSSATTDPYPSAIPAWEGIDYTYFNLTNRSGTGNDTLTTALVDVIRYKDEHFLLDGVEPIIEPIKLLEELLAPLKLWAQIYIPLVDRAPSKLVTRRWGDKAYVALSTVRGEQRTLEILTYVDYAQPPGHFGMGGLRALSSGEIALFRFAVQLASAAEQATLVLLDEPETHLHPKFVSLFVEILDRVVKMTNSCAVIATHSPFVVREIPRRRVLILRNGPDGTVAAQPRLQTFGSSIDLIASAVFADDEHEHLHDRLLETWIDSSPVARNGIDAVLQEYGDQLNQETLSFIARKLRKREKETPDQQGNVPDESSN